MTEDSCIIWRDIQTRCLLESFPATRTTDEAEPPATQQGIPFPGTLAAPESSSHVRVSESQVLDYLHMWHLESNSAFPAMFYAQF